MDMVLTLVSQNAIADDFIISLTQELAHHGAQETDRTALNDHTSALDIFLNASNPDALFQPIKKRCIPAKIDFAIQPSTDNRRKKLLVSDMDSTMIANETLSEILTDVGLRKEAKELKGKRLTGEMTYEETLAARIKLLKGQPVSIFSDNVKNDVIYNPGGSTLVKTMKANGAFTALVTSGWTASADLVADHIGFERVFGNVALTEDGTLTGEAQHPVQGTQSKLIHLNTLCQELNLEIEQAVAVGDGFNDAQMIKAAGLGVGYKVIDLPDHHANAEVHTTDHTALLYFQGYREDEFIS